MKREREPHLPSLVVGLGLVLFGVVLLLDALDAIDLKAGAIPPMLLAIVGAGLLATGVRERRRR
jgi:predicted permease